MQNPFADFKTNEMSIEKIQEFFTPPQYLDRIYTPNAAFITGQRGSGKTMFMRYVENNPKIVNDKVEYIGVYYRLDRLVYGSPVFDTMNYDLFLHHLIIALLKQLVNNISDLYQKHGKTMTDFGAFSTGVCATFFDTETHCHSFNELSEYLEKKRLNTMYYVRNSKRTPPPTICDYSSSLQSVVIQLHQEPWLSEAKILFLLDEYENLNSKQRQAVNGLIKASTYGFTFKIFHRPAIIDTQVLDSSEHLMVQHDFTDTDFYEEIIGGDNFYTSFMNRIVARRLCLFFESNGIPYGEKDLEIENYLLQVSTNDEFLELQKKKNIPTKILRSIQKTLGHPDAEIESYCQTISDNLFTLRLFKSMLDKKLARISNDEERNKAAREVLSNFLNKTSTYRGWVENYRIAVLYLLCFENKVKKQTAGWDQFLSISKGIARHAINMLYYTFENDLSCSGGVFRRFSPEEQTAAVYSVAEKLYEDIIHVPVVGKMELRMIQYFGRVFQICHQDSSIKKWEVNHFVISKQTEGLLPEDAANKVNNVLDAAVTWGHLLKGKATKAKNRQELQEDLSEYQFHPLLSVYFGISWRRKQRFETTYEEVYAAAFDEKQRRTNLYRVANRVLGTSSCKVVAKLEEQQTLFEMISNIPTIEVE